MQYDPAVLVSDSKENSSRLGAVLNGTDRKRTAIWAASVLFSIVVLLASLEFVRRQGLDPWTWFAEVWILIAAIPVQFVAVALALKATEVGLNAAAWATVLRSAYPDEKITFRQTLGVVQGSNGIFTVIPPKFGGFAVLGLYRVAFPTLSIAAVLATRAVQGISSWLLGTMMLLVFGAAHAGFGDQAGFLDGIAVFYRERPLLAIPLTVVVAALIGMLVKNGRAWLRALVAQLTLGGAILRTPRRYLALVVAPTLLAFVVRYGVTATLLTAFGIPLSLNTLITVNVSHGIARSVQVTPGGFGTVQAFDLVALHGVAPVEVIAAYSLSEAAILLVFNLIFGLVAVTWAFGWQRTSRLLRPSARKVDAPTVPAAPPAGVA